ncbi:uncharacterized protein EMH_0018480 [Eimeria mitis]|uniref:WLM domain-containing protein n=1 Tax=Eimeria mitis TaxID=44415 RepID=U6KEN5_9EIME|nr:uncharacterized protein EMH_0018480 [Eimeria mitis]CDJ36485.1 hypothetical protein, conserved [Eimeria mitis]
MPEEPPLLPVGAQTEEPPVGGPSPLLKRFVSSLGSHWHLRWSWGPHVQQQQQQQLLRGHRALKAHSRKAALTSRSTLASSNTISNCKSGSSLELGISGSRLSSRASLTASNSSSSTQQHRLRSFPPPSGSRYSLPSAGNLYMISASGSKTSNSSRISRSQVQQQSVPVTTSCTPTSEPSAPCFETTWDQREDKEQQHQQQEGQLHQETQQHHEQPDDYPDSFITYATSAASPLQPTPTAAVGPYGLSVTAAEYLVGITSSNNSKKSYAEDLPPEILAAAARAMRGAPEEVRLARARLQERQLQRQQQERLQQGLKAPQQQRRSVNFLAARSARPLRFRVYGYAQVNGVTVELKNRGEVAASIHRLHCEYGVPLCREFGFRKERLDELQLQGRSRNRSNTEPQGGPATEAANSSSSSTKWSYCIRIRMRQLQRPQQLLQLPTQLGIFFHELAHLRYMNHGLGFACLLARIFRYATERGLFEPGWLTELPSPWLWERVLFYCGGFVTDTLLQQLLLADPKARAAAGTACNLDAAASTPPAAEAAARADVPQAHSEQEQMHDAASPAGTGGEHSATQVAPVLTNAAAAEPAPVSGAASAARGMKSQPSGLTKQDTAKGSTKTLTVQQQQQQQPVQRQRRIPPTAALRQRTSRGNAGYVQKATTRTNSSSSSNSNSTTTGPQQVLGKVLASAYRMAQPRQQQRQQGLQQSQPQRLQHQQLLKHRSSMNSASSSIGCSSTGSSFRSGNTRRRGNRSS